MIDLPTRGGSSSAGLFLLAARSSHSIGVIPPNTSPNIAGARLGCSVFDVGCPHLRDQHLDMKSDIADGPCLSGRTDHGSHKTYCLCYQY